MLHTSPQCPKPSAANTLSAAYPAAGPPGVAPAACSPCTSSTACWPDWLRAAAVTIYAWLAGAPASQPAALYAAVEPRGVWASLLYTNAPRVPSNARAMRPSDDSWHDWLKLPEPAATMCGHSQADVRCWGLAQNVADRRLSPTLMLELLLSFVFPLVVLLISDIKYVAAQPCCTA
jgi:hypothetical protein